MRRAAAARRQRQVQWITSPLTALRRGWGGRRQERRPQGAAQASASLRSKSDSWRDGADTPPLAHAQPEVVSGEDSVPLDGTAAAPEPWSDTEVAAIRAQSSASIPKLSKQWQSELKKKPSILRSFRRRWAKLRLSFAHLRGHAPCAPRRSQMHGLRLGTCTGHRSSVCNRDQCFAMQPHRRLRRQLAACLHRFTSMVGGSARHLQTCLRRHG